MVVVEQSGDQAKLQNIYCMAGDTNSTSAESFMVTEVYVSERIRSGEKDGVEWYPAIHDWSFTWWNCDCRYELMLFV